MELGPLDSFLRVSQAGGVRSGAGGRLGPGKWAVLSCLGPHSPTPQRFSASGVFSPFHSQYSGAMAFTLGVSVSSIDVSGPHPATFADLCSPPTIPEREGQFSSLQSVASAAGVALLCSTYQLSHGCSLLTCGEPFRWKGRRSVVWA